jgi:hypothetical protein
MNNILTGNLLNSLSDELIDKFLWFNTKPHFYYDLYLEMSNILYSEISEKTIELDNAISAAFNQINFIQ